jgi:hypothetical protein
LVGIFSNFLDNSEGSVAVVVKFAGRVVGVQVFSVEPDFVSWQIGWGRHSVVIRVFALLVLGIGYLGFREVMDLGEQASEGLCLAFFWVVYLKVRFEVKLGVHAIICEEGQKSSSLGNMVVGGELSEG